jgi:autotransporter-associated beta strand protein
MNQRRKRIAQLAGVVLTASHSIVTAQVSGSWVGPSFGSWTTGANWSSNPLVPGGGGYATFKGYTSSIVVDSGSVLLNGLVFDSRGDYSIGTFSGNQLRGSGASLSIDVQASKLNKPGRFTYPGHTIVASIAGNGSITLLKTGPGQISLSPVGSNFISDVRVNAGTLGENGQTSGFGFGIVTLDGGALRIGTGSQTTGSLFNPIIVGPGGGTVEVLMDTFVSNGSLASVSGPGTFTRSGTASIGFNGNLSHTGPTYLLGGGTTTTAMNGSASFTGGGTIVVSGVLSFSPGPFNRIADSTPVELSGSTLSFNGSGNNEQIGTTILGGGQSVVSLSISGARSLITSGVRRDDRGTLIVRGSNLGGTAGTHAHFFGGTGGVPSGSSPFPLIGGGGNAGTPYLSIVPYAFTDGAFPSATPSFLTYDPTVGLRPLDHVTEQLTTIPAADPTANVLISSSSSVPVGGATVNSLMSLNSAFLQAGGGSLAVTSGAVWGVVAAGDLDFGSAEGIIGSATITGNVTGANGITINGPSALNSLSATYTGQTTINSGTVQFLATGTITPGQPGPFGADTSPIILMGRGTGANLVGISSGTLTRDITVRSDASLNNTNLPALRGNWTHTGNLVLEGPLFVDSGMKLMGTISGPGRLVGPSTSAPSGPVTLGGSNAYSGGTDLSTGTILALSDAAFGTGTIYVGDGPASGTGTFGTIQISQFGGPSAVTRTFANPFLMLDGLSMITQSASNSAILNGPIDLNGEPRSIRAVGAFPQGGIFSITINGDISGGELRTDGVFLVTGNQNSQWANRIDNGRLRITSNNALGSAPRLTQIGPGVATGSNGYTLELLGGLTIPAHQLVFSGPAPAVLRSLSGDNIWSGAAQVLGQGTFQVDADTLAVNGGISATTIAGNNIIWKTGPGVLSTKFIRTPNELRLNAGLTEITPDGTTSGTSNVAALMLSGNTDAWTSTLDLTNNDFVLASGATGAAETAIVNQLKNGYANGTWNGAGINSSAAAADPTTALGWVRATDLFTIFPATFSGQTVNNTAILIRYTAQGDGNLDGTTDTLDFNLLASHFGDSGTRWFSGDFNYDGITDTVDFNLLSSGFGKSVVPAAPGVAMTTVPEPAATLGLLVTGALALHRRRRRTV